jgi:hypothetical protein
VKKKKKSVRLSSCGTDDRNGQSIDRPGHQNQNQVRPALRSEASPPLDLMLGGQQPPEQPELKRRLNNGNVRGGDEEEVTERRERERERRLGTGESRRGRKRFCCIGLAATKCRRRFGLTVLDDGRNARNRKVRILATDLVIERERREEKDLVGLVRSVCWCTNASEESHRNSNQDIPRKLVGPKQVAKMPLLLLDSELGRCDCEQLNRRRR